MVKQKTVSAINRARRLRIRQQRWVKIAALFDKPLEQRTADERYTTNYGICGAVRRTRLPKQMQQAIMEFIRNDSAISHLSYLAKTRNDYPQLPESVFEETDALWATLCCFFAVWGRRDREMFFEGILA